MEHQRQQYAQDQNAPALFLNRYTYITPSTVWDTNKVLRNWDNDVLDVEKSFSSLELENDEKAELREEIREVELTPPTLTPRTATPVQDFEQLASDILDVIQRYGQHLPPKDGEGHSGEWLGKPLFMGKVKEQLEKNQPVRLILPAFPWKSVNKVDKVTGTLPDFGEELALYRLNQMCEDIKTIYPLGGQVFIATDGLVFDDVMGIPDEDTWAYGEGLLDMAREHGLKNVKLLRVMDILGYTEGKSLDKELYLSLSKKCREEILASYGRTEAEVRQMMKDDPDTLLTYCGFIRFLEGDLKFSPITASSKAISGNAYRKMVKKVAIQMMIRAESFTKLLQARCPEYVRLSIHPSTGSVKLSFPLIIQQSGDFPRSPWHSSLAVGVDGAYTTVHSKDVRETHDLITRGGRGYYFREKSALWDLGEDMALEPRYPNQLIVKPSRADLFGTRALSAKQLEKIAALRAAHTAGPVVIEGFAELIHARL
ncbi:Pyoverdine/dityrosine biosynthesis protein-domain-containing protein [Biscogniauxia mediterranea]|nr:Pyoverdine/dityrosine biosynthesis protein-domain-containing protein [Biscogniauxia mediterranea]